MEGSDRVIIQFIIRIFVWRDSEKLRNSSVWIFGIMAEIRNGYLPDTSQKRTDSIRILIYMKIT
jgi:hypothetical protein